MRRLWRVTAHFSTPDGLEQASAVARQSPLVEVEVYSPFPLNHGGGGGEGRFRTTLVAALGGIAGAASAVWFQGWVMGSSWPLNIGGRPSFPGPALVPIAFEVGVLAAGFSAFVHFLLSARRGPNGPATVDRFLLVADLLEPRSAQRLAGELRDLGADVEVSERWTD